MAKKKTLREYKSNRCPRCGGMHFGSGTICPLPEGSFIPENGPRGEAAQDAFDRDVDMMDSDGDDDGGD